MGENWTGDLIGRMHNQRITISDLAAELGVTKAYISMILNGYRRPKDAQQRLESAFDAILERKEA